jgi:hypothetical protein
MNENGELHNQKSIGKVAMTKSNVNDSIKTTQCFHGSSKKCRVTSTPYSLPKCTGYCYMGLKVGAGRRLEPSG